MKKLLLVAVITVFGFASVQAQVSFGAKAGVNFASLNGDDADGLDGLTSFHVGGVANIAVSEKFSVQPEVLYSAQGASSDGGDLKVDYINVPVLASFTVADGLSIQAGPQVGILLSAKADGDDVKEFLKSTDFSGVFGLAYSMDSGINFAARYNVGLGNILDDSDGDLKNGVIALSVGYMFN